MSVTSVCFLRNSDDTISADEIRKVIGIESLCPDLLFVLSKSRQELDEVTLHHLRVCMLFFGGQDIVVEESPTLSRAIILHCELNPHHWNTSRKLAATASLRHFSFENSAVVGTSIDSIET